MKGKGNFLGQAEVCVFTPWIFRLTNSSQFGIKQQNHNGQLAFKGFVELGSCLGKAVWSRTGDLTCATQNVAPARERSTI